ncbi:MAG: hypothetical protein F2827_06340 [Actinobacteria bacterium]|nr:hypothetical protein [Actinomycetota bacterium]
MELLLKRTWLTEKSTISELFVDGVRECFVLEDRYRPPPETKVYGQTAIPNGRYEVAITQSPRFKRLLPLLLDVPGYEGVRIHPGNTAADTEGCLLPGCRRGVDQVFESRVAFDALFAKLSAARGPVFITVTT